MPALLSIAALLLAAAATTPARAGADEPPPEVLDAGRYYVSPVGEVRWLDAARDVLLVSDMRRSVAGISTREGRVLWNHGALGGRLDRVWRLGDYVVVAGVGLEVLARDSGAVLWRRMLGCATGGPCVERAWWAGPEGVLVSGQGAVHERLGLLGVADGKPRWREVAGVSDPVQVEVSGGVVYVRDGTTPPSIGRFDLATGTPRGRWTWSDVEAPPEEVGFAPLPDGGFLTWQIPSGGPFVLRQARVDQAGRTVSESATRASDRRTEVVWLAAVDGAVALLLQAPDGPARLVGPGDNGQVRPVEPEPRPAVAEASGWIVATRRGDTGLQSFGYRPGAPGSSWEWPVPAEGGPVALEAVGGDVLVAAGRGSARLAILDPASGALETLGTLDAGADEVHVAARAGDTLYVAAGRGVHGLPAFPFERLEVVTTKLLEDGRVEAAAEGLAPLLPFEDDVPGLARLRASVDGARLARLRTWLERGRVVTGLRELASVVGSETEGRTERLEALAPHLASMIGDLVLARRGTPPEAVGDGLAALAEALAERLGRDADALREAEGESLRDLRAAVLVVAASALEAGRPAAAAALIRAWRDGAFPREAGMAALHRAAAARALEARLGALAPALTGEDPEARRAAREALEASPWPAVALASETFLPPRLVLVDDPDPERSRRAGAALVMDLEAEIARVRRDLGDGLGEPGCAAVCRALAATCEDGCRAPSACVDAGERCRERCGEHGRARWSPPPGAPGGAGVMRCGGAAPE